MKELEDMQKVLPRRKSGWRRLRRIACLGGLAAAAVVWAVQHPVIRSAEGSIYAVGEVPLADCIMVPGARIYPDGSPYPMLVDRLTVAAELFGLGKAPVVLVSGRGSSDCSTRCRRLDRCVGTLRVRCAWCVRACGVARVRRARVACACDVRV